MLRYYLTLILILQLGIIDSRADDLPGVSGQGYSDPVTGLVGGNGARGDNLGLSVGGGAGDGQPGQNGNGKRGGDGAPDGSDANVVGMGGAHGMTADNFDPLIGPVGGSGTNRAATLNGEHYGAGGGGGGNGLYYNKPGAMLTVTNAKAVHSIGYYGASAAAGGRGKLGDGAGGGGGAGLYFNGDTLNLVGENPSVGFTAQGGAGGFFPNPTGAGAIGGGGGAGIVFVGKSLTVSGVIVQGGNNGPKPSKPSPYQGNAGAGIDMASDGATIKLTNQAPDRQGAFRGTFIYGGGVFYGGQAGDGITVSGNNNTVLNSATLVAGGQAGDVTDPSDDMPSTLKNVGVGIRISGDNNSFVSSGEVESGPTYDKEFGGIHGYYAVLITGNNNKFTWDSGGKFIGNIVSAGKNNSMIFGGAAGSSLDWVEDYTHEDYTTQGFANYHKTGSATWTMNRNPFAAGETAPWYVEEGTLDLIQAADFSNIDSMSVDGTLSVTGMGAANVSFKRLTSTKQGGKVNIASKTFTISDAQTGDNFRGEIAGTGSVTIVKGEQIFSGANTYTGGTTISAGKLQLGDGTDDGSIVGDVVDNGSLIFNNQQMTEMKGIVSGTGDLTQANIGTLNLSGNNTYAGGTNLNAGVISVSQEENLGNANGALNFNGGTLQVMGSHYEGTDRTINFGAKGGSFDIDDADNTFSLSTVFTGAGPLNKLGKGTLALSGDSTAYTGATTVSDGLLRLDGGTLGGTVDVGSGATLAGQGKVVGAATLESGATLAGQSNQVLDFNNGLTMAAGSNVNVTLTGGPSDDRLFNVTGDLALNGQLNIEQGSAITVGVYRIFDYSGALSGTIALGDTDVGNISEFSIQTSIDHQVNLVSTGGRHFNFWDGNGPKNNGVIDGGDGVWNSNNDNWTGYNGQSNNSWPNDAFAVFGGAKGTVTIDNGFKPIVDGMQFMTDGYVLQGGPLELSGTGDQLILVGDGSLESASMTATIDSVIEGNEGLLKSGMGNLVLGGANTYTGTTTVTEGLLTLGDGGAIDGASNIVLAGTRYGQGDFAVDKNSDFTLSNQISGTGEVFKRGTGTTTFAGENSFIGGLAVEAGTAQAGIADSAFGSGRVSIKTGATLDLANFNETIGSIDGNASGDGNITLGSGTLTLQQSLHSDYSGVISGTGGLVKNGSADLVLYGANSYSGLTAVNEGELTQAAQGALSGFSSYSVAKGADINLGGFSTNMAALSNGGQIFFGGSGGTVLSIAGDYSGTGGSLNMSTVLGDDKSLTDQMRVAGSTSGTTTINITNRSGLGAQTINGIKIIDVGGQSNGTFALHGDYVTNDGQQAIMTTSAYAYTLNKNSVANPNDGAWYLESQYTKPDPVNPPNPTPPNQPRYSPAAPIYESYASNLQALNGLPTLQQRVGDRYLQTENGSVSADSQSQFGSLNNAAIWGRIEGAHNRLKNSSTAGMLRQTANTYALQAGVEGQFYENEQGKLLASITGKYGNAASDIANLTGDGSGDINTQGWGVGATATWYGNNGFYLDAQAQANWYSSDLNVDAVNRILVDGNNGFGYALGLEAGKRIAIDDRWSLTPQAQLEWSSVDADTFTDMYGARISQRQSNTLVGRLGIAANYETNLTGANGLNVKTSLYGIANIYQKLIDDGSVNYGSTQLVTDNNSTWASIGFGATYAWADNKYAIFGEGSTNTPLNAIGESYTIKGNVGFKYRW